MAINTAASWLLLLGELSLRPRVSVVIRMLLNPVAI
jgi:hypothetical protein